MSVVRTVYPNFTDVQLLKLQTELAKAYFEIEQQHPITSALFGVTSSRDVMVEQDIGCLIILLAAEMISTDQRFTQKFSSSVRRQLRSLLVDMS